VPHTKDESNTNTLPDPELNPLVNPLLAAHMGRWAEVYFTNPPEKRGQAVSDLLRELEKVAPPESAAGPVAVQYADRSAADRDRTDRDMADRDMTGQDMERSERISEDTNSAPSRLEAAHTCIVCAHPNAAEQRFCGMCGTPLQVPAETLEPQVTDAVPELAPEVTPIAAGSWWERSVGEPDTGTESERMMEPAFGFLAAAEENRQPKIQDPAEPAWPMPQRNLFQPRLERKAVFSRSQLYLGAVLAILFMVLGYVAWRGTSSSAAAPKSAPVIPPPQAQLPSSQIQSGPVQSREVQSGQVQPSQVQPAQAQTETRRLASTPTEQAADSQPAARIVPERIVPARIVPASAVPANIVPARVVPASPVPTSTVPVATGSSNVAAASQSGAEEMATAAKYLNGAPGVARDSGEAAQWLWKAVGKGNSTATIALSDLYLRGDGVPKDCDQARVLLDAAARKGENAAAAVAVRLRNLQAFGCQ